MLLFLALPTLAHQADFEPFGVLEGWRAAVVSGDSSAIAALYSKDPVPVLQTSSGKVLSLADEIQFWASLKSKGLTSLSYEIAKRETPGAKLHLLLLEVTLSLNEGGAPQKEYIVVSQAWAQLGNQQLIVASQHSPASRLRPPLHNKEIYDSSADPAKQIAAALHSAGPEHKRVLLVFGGNWCFDCHVLDEAFHSPEIAPTADKSFEIVHIDIGHMDKNLDVAKKYDVPLDRGVPAIAVLDSDGKLLFSQKRGEFEAARSLAPEDILAFLNKWKPPLSR